MKTISQLRDDHNALIRKATALVNSGLDTAEKKAEHRQVTTELDNLQSRINMLTTIEGKRSANPAPIPVNVTVTAPDAPVQAPSIVRSINDRAEREERQRISKAWRNYLAGDTRENRDIVTSSTGAAFVPQLFEDSFTNALSFYGPVAGLVKTKMQSNGRAAKFPQYDDTANMGMTLVAESSSVTGLEADPVISSDVLLTDSVISFVKFSMQLLDDAFDLEEFLAKIAAPRVGFALQTAITTGLDFAGTTLPNSPSGGLLAGVSASVTGVSGVPTYANLSSLKASVNAAYRGPGSGFMVAQATYDALASAVDSTGRPLYGYDSDGNLLVANSPVFINSSMPAYTIAGSKAVLFGDYSRAYGVLNGGFSIHPVNERFADTLERAVIFEQRIGATALVSTAVKALETHS